MGIPDSLLLPPIPTRLDDTLIEVGELAKLNIIRMILLSSLHFPLLLLLLLFDNERAALSSQDTKQEMKQMSEDVKEVIEMSGYVGGE